MKNFKLIILVASFLLIPVFLFAYSDPKGWFKCQKDVEDNVSNSSQLMSTICYGGKLWNFIYYNASSGLGNGTIIQRRLSNLGGTSKIEWDSPEKKDDIRPFQNVGSGYFQPAPVIYKSKLYLFYNNQYQEPCFSVYNPSDSTWSTQILLSTSPDWWNIGRGAVATVVDDKLCIVTKAADNKVNMIWTNDLLTWHKKYLGFNNGGDNEERFASLSGLSTTILKEGKRKQLMMVGYVDPDHHAYCATIEFDTQNNLLPVTQKLISNSREYQGAAIAEGTVAGDPISTGHCIQAFLKREITDGGALRYRIIRCQSKEGGNWEEREDNLVKKNYNWADHELNLTVANFAVPDGKDFRQYMCLIYRGYDDGNHPLNCAWTETDKAVWLDSRTDTLKDIENIHYIGFIEGPPPFFVNDSTREEPLNYKNVGSISEVGFTSISTTYSSTEYKMDLGIKQSLDVRCIREEFSQAYNHVWNKEATISIKEKYTREAEEENLGYAIYIYPEIKRDHYKLVDVTGALIDSLYFFQVTQTYSTKDTYKLPGGLNPADPKTYERRADRDFSNYTDPAYYFGTKPCERVTWNKGGTDEVSITCKSSSSNTNGTTTKLYLGYAKEDDRTNKDIFNIGFEGSFEWTSTMTTEIETELGLRSALNYPNKDYPNQIQKLEYDCYWIKPNHTDGVNNWWLPEGAKSQDAWCVTYEAQSMLPNGSKLTEEVNNNETVSSNENTPVQDNTTSSINTGNQMEQLVTPESALSQNHPNPFDGTTKFKYQLGSDNLLPGTQDSFTRLVVYDISGHQIAILVNENKAPGSYEVDWDASQFTPGVYFYSLQSGNFKDVKKMILLK